MTLLARLRDRCLRLLVGPVLRGEVEHRPERLRWLAEHGAVPEGVCRCPGCGAEGEWEDLFWERTPSDSFPRRNRNCRHCLYFIGGYPIPVPQCSQCRAECACCAKALAMEREESVKRTGWT